MIPLKLPTSWHKKGFCRGHKACGVKQGALVRAGKDKYTAFPPVVDVIDPVGAGDTFDAGFIHQFIRGAKLEDCLKFANIAGALVCNLAPVAREAFRDAAHRDAFLRKHAAGVGSAGGSGSTSAKPR